MGTFPGRKGCKYVNPKGSVAGWDAWGQSSVMQLLQRMVGGGACQNDGTGVQ